MGDSSGAHEGVQLTRWGGVGRAADVTHEGHVVICSGQGVCAHPEPTKTPSMPSCIIIAASAGVATPPAEKLTTGRRPASAVCFTRAIGAWMDLANVYISSSSIVLSYAQAKGGGERAAGAQVGGGETTLGLGWRSDWASDSVG